MEKKLPKVFVNKIDKKLNNNESVFYGKSEEVREEKDSIKEKVANKIDLQNINIQQKIKNIFNSPRYVYKANVNIKLKAGQITKQIIGKNKNHIIAIDNELIPINDILDIEFVD